MTAPVITFYSYKGGVGRTQALANVAVRLANAGKRVIVVDMDLESPGVHAFFSPPGEQGRTFQERDFAEKAGVIDYLERCSALPEEEPSVEGMLVPCAHAFLRGDTGGSIRLLPPGRLDDSYVERLAAFSWEKFYLQQHGYAYIELLRRQLCDIADIVLVDSRTGLTDAGMVCTFQLPDTVVVLFALHYQGIEGAERVARAVAQRREEDPGAGRAGHVLLVPSRVDDAAELERAKYFLNVAKTHLSPIPNCELLEGHQDRIPYLAWFAYGENIVDPQEDNRLSAAYQRLTGRIEATLHLSSPEASMAKFHEVDSPLFSAVMRESVQLQQDAGELARSIRGSWDANQLIERLARHASDALYRQAEIGRRIGVLNDLLRSMSELGQEPSQAPVLKLPRSLADCEAFPGTVEQAVRGAESDFSQGVKQRLRAAASGDDAVVQAMWGEVQKGIETATLADLRAKIASFEVVARRTSVDAQLQRGALEYETLVGRYPLAKERVVWVDERIQRLMDQADTNQESTSQLENLLRLRVLDRCEQPLLPVHWTGYDVLCMLLGDEKARSEKAFADIGQHLWMDAWQAFFAGGNSSPFAGAGVDSQKQLEMVTQVEPLVVPLIDRVSASIVRSWAEGNAARDRVLRLFAERRADPCLRSAIGRLAEERDDLTDIHASWLLDLPPFEGVAFRAPLRRVLEHLAKDGRAGEAYYGLSTVAMQDRSILEDRSFFFVHVAFIGLVLGMPDRASVVEQFLYDGGFSDRLGATPYGAALLSILGCGLEHRVRSPEIRTAARSALRQSLTIDLPPALQRVVEHPSFEDPSYAWTAMKVEQLLSQVQSVGERQIHASWHLHAYYEAELKKHFAEDLGAIRELPVGDVGDLSLSRSADDWITIASTVVSRDHQGGLPVGGAREKIRAIFDQANSLLRDVSEALNHLSDRARTVGEVAADAELARAAARAIETWLDEAEQHGWLRDQIRNLWETAT